MELILTFILGTITGLIIAAIGIKIMYQKKHGHKEGGTGCIRDCKACLNPCYHKGRF